jgi:hypothetical protein
MTETMNAPEGYRLVESFTGKTAHLLPSRLWGKVSYPPALCGKRGRANGWSGLSHLYEGIKLCAKCAASYESATGKKLELPVNTPKPRAPKGLRKSEPQKPEVQKMTFQIGDVVKIRKFGTIVTLVSTFGSHGTEFTGQRPDGTTHYYHRDQFEELISRSETSPEPTGEVVLPPKIEMKKNPDWHGRDSVPEVDRVIRSVSASLRSEIEYRFEVYSDSGYEDSKLELLIMALEDTFDYASERIEDKDFSDHAPVQLHSWVKACKRLIPEMKLLRKK